MKTILLLITITYASVSFSQQTFVPDDGLEGRLQQLGLDSGELDNLVLTANINKLENFDFSNFIVTDITGLQDFTSLKSITMIAEIDDLSPIEGLTLLEELFIKDATDSTLDLSELENLTYLNINESALVNINLSSNTNLTELTIDTTPVNQITFSNNSLIEDFYIIDTEIQNLDLSQLTQLKTLDIVRNPMLESIDITESSLLETIRVDDNVILTDLNLSNNTSLLSVSVNDNLKLVSIDIKNGNNTAIGQTFKVKDNPLLDCVQVDDVAWSWLFWRFPTDYFAGFSTDCSVTNNLTRIPDFNFEKRLITLGYDMGPPNGMVHTPNILNVTSLSVGNLGISDLTGIQDFTSLETLRVFDNALTTLDVSNNIELKDLRCFNNQITVLDVSKNTKLQDLRAFDNSIETLDFSNNTLLESVKVYNNSLTSLNVKNGNNSSITTFEATGNSNLDCIDVDDLNFANNNWTDIDAQTSFSLNCSSTGENETVSIPDAYFEDYIETLGAGNGVPFDGLVDADAVATLTSVDLNGLETVESLSGIEFFTALTYLNVSGNLIESIDISSNTELIYFDISDNNITSIDVSNNTKLQSLIVSNNNLTDLDVTKLIDLENLRCNSNQLLKLDVTKNTALAELNCSLNSLVILNLLSNINLEDLYCEQNNIEYLDLSQNTSLRTFTCIQNSLVGLNLKNGNNTLLSNASFAAFDNPSLSCIQVDDVNYSNSNWAQIDMTASFSENCTPVNDDCSFTIPLVLGQDTPGDTTSASAGVNNPNCAQNGIVLFDVWYEVAAPTSGSIVLNLSTQPLIAKIAIYESCSDAQPFACDEDTLSVDNLTPGQNYYLQVWLEATPGANKSESENRTFTLTAQDSSVLSVDDFNEEKASLLLYPNPTSTILNVSFSSNQILETIDVYNLIGKKVISENVDNQQNIKLNVSNLSTGIYIVKVKSGNKIISKKLVIN